MENLDEHYWSNRYQKDLTGWDLGVVSPPLKAYFDQLTDKSVKILIPGCGNAYEAEYLNEIGFKNVFVIDVSSIPLENFHKRCPSFPKEHLLEGDFFKLEASFDLIIEQTFFCALDPSLRGRYAKKMNHLLKERGKLVGLLFDTFLNEEHPPFGGTKVEYLKYFKDLFEIKTFETCYNSVKPRMGRELFIKLIKKQESK